MKASCAFTVLLLSTVITPATLAQEQGRDGDSQSTVDFCFHARPAPACRLFGVTDFGVLLGRTHAEVTGLPKQTTRAVAEWGVMRNLGQRHAIGVSWFFTLDDDAISTGPTVRYRRWLKGKQSLDFGVGTPIATVEESYGDLRRGSALGLVKYNPVPWFGVAVRPEVLRRVRPMPCPPFPCAERTESSSRVLVGIELSESPGAIVSGIFSGLVGLLAIAFSGGG